jgi:hypothetical protein
MASSLIGGPTVWNATVDDDGHRNYTIEWRVAVSSSQEGPATVLQTSGLPLPGSPWSFYSGTEIDIYAWCRPTAEVTPHPSIPYGSPIDQYIVKQTFSTRPPTIEQGRRSPNGGGSSNCAQKKIEDPLLEPPKVNGGSIRISEEVETDLAGNYIRTSARERVRGKGVEFDKYYSNVHIEMNVASLQNVTIEKDYLNHVNTAELWGYPVRSVKLSEFRWERRYYGLCYIYYTWFMTFEVRVRKQLGLLGTTYVGDWDRILLDEGTMVLRGKWDTDLASLTYGQYQLAPGVLPGSLKPGDYIKYQDFHGNAANVVLDGYGRPWDSTNITTGTGDDNAGQIPVVYYPEVDHLLLGIPSTL